MLRKTGLAALVCCTLAATPAMAGMYVGAGPSGSYSANITYSATDDTSGSLSIVLENTSPTGNKGYITAFVFNNPDDWITSATLSSSNANFGILGLSNDGINAQPYGYFDLGASTGGSFEGSGKPQKGIAAGDSASFTFGLQGSHMNSLTVGSFLQTLPSSGKSKSKEHGDDDDDEEDEDEEQEDEQQGASFVVRFRGFEDESSDKVPLTTVPEPAAVAVWGLGLAAIGLVWRRRCAARAS